MHFTTSALEWPDVLACMVIFIVLFSYSFPCTPWGVVTGTSRSEVLSQPPKQAATKQANSRPRPAIKHSFVLSIRVCLHSAVSYAAGVGSCHRLHQRDAVATGCSVGSSLTLTEPQRGPRVSPQHPIATHRREGQYGFVVKKTLIFNRL